MAYSILEDIAVTTAIQSLGIFTCDKSLRKSFFFINKGPSAVTVRIYGSPTGASIEQYENKTTGYCPYTNAELELHYRLITTFIVNPNDNNYFDLTEYIYEYFRVTVQTAAGTATINYAFQKMFVGL